MEKQNEFELIIESFEDLKKQELKEREEVKAKGKEFDPGLSWLMEATIIPISKEKIFFSFYSAYVGEDWESFIPTSELPPKTASKVEALHKAYSEFLAAFKEETGFELPLPSEDEEDDDEEDEE